MSNVIQFYDIQQFRKQFCFRCKNTQVKDEDGILRTYPCIVLYEKETNIPVYYTGMERYLCHLAKSELLNGKTLSARAYAVCHFLNYLLNETEINSVHECTLEIIRDFIVAMKIKKDGTEYGRDTWVRYRDYVIDYLVMYYTYNRDVLQFRYVGEELISFININDDKHHKRFTIVHNASLHISAPKMTHRKNRLLIYGYLDLLLFEAKKYEPDITLGIALGAYAGLREGEVVNVTCGRVRTSIKGFGRVAGVEIDLTDQAPHFQKWSKKTDPGTIKKKRVQKVYYDFVSEIADLYNYHIALMASKGIDTSKDAPLFVNKQGNPMTVQTYSDRIKRLFYERFLPSLKITCERQGTYADNAAYIEAYELEYPGAHMFRHWFTMYLLTKAKLTSGEIMKWRGDVSQEAMYDYIHVNTDLIHEFEQSNYAFQSQILEEIY